MKLQIWMKIFEVTTKEAARLFKVSHTSIYHYIYLGVIPKPKVMQRIYRATNGMVSANDFNDTAPEILEKELLEQAKLNETKKEDDRV